MLRAACLEVLLSLHLSLGKGIILLYYILSSNRTKVLTISFLRNGFDASSVQMPVSAWRLRGIDGDGDPKPTATFEPSSITFTHMPKLNLHVLKVRPRSSFGL